jgi:hypothetical protein
VTWLLREMVAAGDRPLAGGRRHRIRLTGRLLPHQRPEAEMGDDAGTRKCPVCGRGDLVDITYREGSPDEVGEEIQTSDTRQVEAYSCGHERKGPRLDRSASGSEALEVERRETEETVQPPEG